MHRLEIIGEAVGRISDDFKAQHPDIPWREMKTMRNLVIHQYDSVDYTQVWDTAQNDLPALIVELEKIFPNQ